MCEKIKVIYIQGKEKHEILVSKGANLRRSLLAAGFSPYTTYTEKVNCGGMGICATCGVWLEGPGPEPIHWHDKIAKKHGYPRLSCQIHVDKPITVVAVDKKFWGLREMKQRQKKEGHSPAKK